LTSHPMRLMVLCVDGDDDVGVKAHIDTPVMGRGGCFEAASKLVMADPEEADSNTIFAALKEYDELRARGFEVEVALVAGTQRGGTDRALRIRGQLDYLLKRFPADGFVFISDGVGDEAIIPVVQSFRPIISVRRVVVRYSPSVEVSYAILGRYLKLLVEDPRYSRYTLGLPGMLLLTYGVLALLDQLRAAAIVSAILVGGALLFKGFELDRKILALGRLSPLQYFRLSSFLASSLLMVAALVTGLSAVAGTPQYRNAVTSFDAFLANIGYLTGVFLESSVFWIWLALGVGLAGGMLHELLRWSRIGYREGMGLLTLLLLYTPTVEFARFLKEPRSPLGLAFWVFIALALTFTAAGLLLPRVVSRELESGQSQPT